MNNEWFNAQEIAGLPEMPGTQQNVKLKAKRDGWLRRPRQARGGGFEYHISSLPLNAQNALSDSSSNSDLVWLSAQELAGLPGLPGTDRRVRAKADKEKWESRQKKTGKGLEYHIHSLPLVTQQELTKTEDMDRFDFIVRELSEALTKKRQADAEYRHLLKLLEDMQ